MIDTVLIDGVPLDPGLVVADLTILHGRRRVSDGPEASSATLLIVQPSVTMPDWSASAVVALVGDTGAMFTGRIVDRRLEHGRSADGQAYGLLTVTAAGPVAALGYRTVGDEPWPAEAGSARAARILTLAEVPYVIDGARDAIVLPRDVDSRPALDLLDDLAESTAAAVVDLPDGRVMYQPLAERARPVHPFPWKDFDPALTWDGFDPGFTWDDFRGWYSADSVFPVQIPAAAVEWEPSWTSGEDTVLNHVRVGYGPEPEGGGRQPWVEVVDQGSVDDRGKRYRYLGSQLRDAADALAYASWILTTRAEPHWRLDDVIVHLDLLDEATRVAVLGLVSGDHVTVAPMPAPAPAAVAEGIVEGWTYVLWGVEGQLFERITLHVSSLLESLAVPRWSDHPLELEWGGYSPIVTWADLVDLDAIGA